LFGAASVERADEMSDMHCGVRLSPAASRPPPACVFVAAAAPEISQR
jgi:hypothetical protein